MKGIYDTLNFIANIDLEELLFIQELSSVKIILSYQCIPESRIVFSLDDVLHVSISRDPEHKGFVFFLCEVSLAKLDTGRNIFSKLNHGYLNYKGETYTYSELKNLFHFHAEGEIGIDIICQTVTDLREFT
ncbi:hypothetical protein [Beggiatoa leptomitoformis]|uniref:Uncharacterized protein n=1 Tax=Beggiatoa leptomitoformis TaxID=288004 RepID=A0A2N9YG89_9GAMM|nr:hypothetical protein [Beggiatoa leptomitoformis]ALG68112.1 hypothetical protein AL038_10840 [Beggiatoa leptomitoformis]AUI69591.1 hypothetical protein BLE401_13430 [Beggiatoa leptomitoformis]